MKLSRQIRWLVYRGAAQAGIAIALVTVGFAGQGGKATICHIPPGNPANGQTITVSSAALSAHIGHGDSIGECAPACAGSGVACVGDAECCSSFCNRGTCDTPCGPNGNSCSADGQCCSGSCDDGICVTPCSQEGASCNDNAQCCTGNCQNGACAPVCTANGGPCSANGDCCTGNCKDGTCADACANNGTTCSSSAECCSDICSGEGICTAECTIGPELEGPFCNADIPCCPGSGVCIFGACFLYDDLTCAPQLGAACDEDAGKFCCFDHLCIDHVCVEGL